ncbi:MAG: hypothetical protein IKU45_02360 [Clostridia bacterium]|nr:hypothetical protein [Clostridia bacterium]
MGKLKSKITVLNIITAILFFCLGIYRCFTYPIERLLSGRTSLEYIDKTIFNGISGNIFNFTFCGLIIFALFSKKASKVLLLIANCLLWIKSSFWLFGERLDVSLHGGETDFFDFMHIRLNGYFYLSLFIIILSICILEKRKKNIPYYLRFSVVIPFVLLVAVLILRMLNYEEPVTNMIDDRVLAYFSNSQVNVRAALIEFTNTVNKIVEVVKFVAFTLIIVKIVDFFPKKAIVQNESNNEISL